MLINPLKVEEVKSVSEKILTEMGATDLLFPDPKKNLLVVLFNCKILTSFKATLPGWTYSGIQLDPTTERQYKIDFIGLQQ